MVHPHTRSNQVPQEPNLATVVADLQWQLLEQQQETNRLRDQIVRLNQMPRVNEVPPRDNPMPLVALHIPEVNQRIPQNPEVPTMYYNREILAAQQDEFNSMKQGSMTVLEAVKKFEQLARLCPELVPNETEKVRRMMKMFQTFIAKQDKEAKALIFKAKKEEKAVLKQSQPKQNQEFYSKDQTSNFAQNFKQFKKNKRKGNASNQGQQGNYPQKKNNQGLEGRCLTTDGQNLKD
ncbi:hypothetical protein TIFTF001_052334 [Ficus carica]|uniref:Retrotransposon gag domain-containing protein n=1 Tax=Ficus carica TaxID=3494 RepID=A0AA88EG10_FICCA|nr:hypothetical protein TIFTF001_052332 [Ficus carica]GMN74227.1 hypothetical protein TIFTF001_052334 [Ficus carica]